MATSVMNGVTPGNTPSVLSTEETPPAADLRAKVAEHPLPVIAPGTVDAEAMTGDRLRETALTALDSFNRAVNAKDADVLADCFFPDQAYWRDALALTWHLRTFMSPSVIAANLLQTLELRGLVESKFTLCEEEPLLITINPVFQFIDCSFAFATESPRATCNGRMLLLPMKSGEQVHWKLWCLSTWVDNLSVHPENEALLRVPGRDVEAGGDMPGMVMTDVFIVGGGNAAVSLAARLKALGVDSVMADRNANPGDNWALRYDCMRFHAPTSFCDMAYLPYEKHLQSPHLLTRDDLAQQMRHFVKSFHLNLITSAKIQSTIYEPSEKRWRVSLKTPRGALTVVSRHLVQATGQGSQKPHMPAMADENLYGGIANLHSAHYKSAAALKAQGVRSVLVIGSANTAFDVAEDCYAAGLQVTMVARSPTYVMPLEHIFDPRGLGAFDQSVAATDRSLSTLPTWVEGNFTVGLMSHLSAQEPDRYAALAAAGFPVLDGRHPSVSLTHNLLERAGGHYIDIGGTKLIADGKVGVRANVEPVAYTAAGVRFSDGTTADADAIVWCTGFADRNARLTAAEILGGGGDADRLLPEKPGVLGPSDIAARLDATWGVDCEGETRGMWKRHERLHNYWVMGGHAQHHRWHSRTLALQIKAELEGILPPAYRQTATKFSGVV